MIAGWERVTLNQRRLIGGGMLLLGFFLVLHFVLLPLRSRQRTQAERLREFKQRICEADIKVKSMKRMREEVATLGSALQTVTNDFVLRPLLGSYPAPRNIHRVAGESSFNVAFVREQGVQATPVKEASGKRAAARSTAKKNAAKKPPAAFSRYVVEVGGDGSYADIIDLVGRLEQENPYMGVLALNVRAVSNSPERHRVTMRFEWPVDADPPASR